MAPKNNAKAAKGKGKDASADDAKGKGGKGAVKGAQSINVRHILVCFLLFFFPLSTCDLLCTGLKTSF
jgi:hypothetical protein